MAFCRMDRLPFAPRSRSLHFAFSRATDGSAGGNAFSIPASGRERLKASGGRCVELTPVDLLLEPMIGFVTNNALIAQPIELLPLTFDGAKFKLVIVGRCLRVVRICGDRTCRRVLL